MPGDGAADGGGRRPRDLGGYSPGVSEPIQPLRVDLAKVVAWGTAAWAVALVVTVVLGATGRTSWTPTAVCATGVALGLLGIWWSHRHDSLGRRL